VLLAPHGKTTMAPQIFAQQLAAGVGITVASVQQLGICVRFGVRRVIMANQLLGAARSRAIVCGSTSGLEFHFLIVRRRNWRRSRISPVAEDVAQAHGAGRAGVPGGRTGCRAYNETLAVARAVAREDRRAVGSNAMKGWQVTGNAAPTRNSGELMRR